MLAAKAEHNEAAVPVRLELMTGEGEIGVREDGPDPDTEGEQRDRSPAHDLEVLNATDGSPGLSVVVPVLDEREALPGLIEEIDAAVATIEPDYELILVDDGSTDGSTQYLAESEVTNPHVEAVLLPRNVGKSSALAAGFERTRGAVVVTLDGDGQDDPGEIPALLAKLDDGYDLVSGWKRSRQDPGPRRWASKLFNRVTARISGVELNDFNCGLKAYRGDLIRSLSIYGEMHRFIPVLGAQRGWSVAEIEVKHRPRRYGKTKFGLERYVRGMLDLIAVVFMDRYGNRPLHLFGGFGLISILIGLLLGLYLTIEKIGGEAIGERPLLLLSVLLIVVGIQFLTFGLLAHMLVAMRYDRPSRESRATGPERPGPNELQTRTERPR